MISLGTSQKGVHRNLGRKLGFCRRVIYHVMTPLCRCAAGELRDLCVGQNGLGQKGRAENPFKIYIYVFIYFWLLWVFVAVQGLSLVVASVGYFLAAVRGLLVVVASLGEGHRL